MRRKWVPLGIIVLFVGSAFVPTIAQDTETFRLAVGGNWLYVGGDGPGNYSKIQEAINDSSPGDTIYVYHGTYYEHIIINKTLHLMGEDRNITIIDGIEYYIATVQIVTEGVTDGVIINGFTIRNGGRGLSISNNDAPDKIRNISVFDNLITLNDEGLIINGCVNSTITNNIIKNNKYQGIYILRAENISYTRNIIKNNYHGITCSESNSQRIEMNIIEDNDIGILLFTGENNCYIRNIIRNNSVGIQNEGVHLSEAPDLQRIEQNTIENNDKGIEYQLYSQNRVLSNNFISNGIDLSITIAGFNLLFQMSDFLVFLLWSHLTKWDGNYWDTWHKTSPKPIGGFLILMVAAANTREYKIWIPYIKFDWHPAQEPYEFPGVI